MDVALLGGGGAAVRRYIQDLRRPGRQSMTTAGHCDEWMISMVSHISRFARRQQKLSGWCPAGALTERTQVDSPQPRPSRLRGVVRKSQNSPAEISKLLVDTLQRHDEV